MPEKKPNRIISLETITIVVLILIILGPVLYLRSAWFSTSPDIYYVKAKAIHLFENGLFADPITGYDTFHPPYYHLLLSILYKIIPSMDTLLFLITIFNIISTVSFTYLILKHLFGKNVALLTILLYPFIFYFMGPSNILLATSFYFSLPFMLAGLYLFLKYESINRYLIASSILWGVAFLLSPMYIFLIAILFIYLLLIRKDYKAFGYVAIAFVITIIPFFIQAYALYAQDLVQTTSFAIWRGIPDILWLKTFFTDYFAPHLVTLLHPGPLLHIAFICLFGISIYFARKWHWIIPLLAIAYFLTYYHFSMQYAIRIQLILSCLIVAFVVKFALSQKINKLFIIIPVLIISAFSIYVHYSKTYYDRSVWLKGEQALAEIGTRLWNNIGNHIAPDELIFCSKTSFFRYLMTHYNVHGMAAYRTLEYYQLDHRISESLDRDYRIVMNSRDINVINAVADKYGIKASVAASIEYNFPIYETLAEHWTTVYQDEYFSIYKRPGTK